MHITLGNGDFEMCAVRLTNGNWAVLLQKHDITHEIGEAANSQGEVYIPKERDVVIEIGRISSGRVFQDAVNHAMLFAVGHIPESQQPTPPPPQKREASVPRSQTSGGMEGEREV